MAFPLHFPSPTLALKLAHIMVGAHLSVFVGISSFIDSVGAQLYGVIFGAVARLVLPGEPGWVMLKFLSF